MRIFAFNGDADGLCALTQLRLAESATPSDDRLVSGVKRDIQLLARVQANAADTCTVLDVSLESNRADLLRLLGAGVRVRYFDHHFAGDPPLDPLLDLHVDASRDVCTSILVDRHLDGRFRHWAVVGAFGDNLVEPAQCLATTSGLDTKAADELRQLGILLNYNAYGESVADLHFLPEALAAEMLCYREPRDLIHCSSFYGRLADGYREDMERTRRLTTQSFAGGIFVELPNEAWARRTGGPLANDLARSHPTDAIAILSERPAGYVVSIRVPGNCAIGADEFCRRFPTGGGRRGAAGINHLPSQQVDEFRHAFEQQFRTR